MIGRHGTIGQNARLPAEMEHNQEIERVNCLKIYLRLLKELNALEMPIKHKSAVILNAKVTTKSLEPI